MIRRGECVYVSLAPSFTAAFPEHDFAAMTSALKKSIMDEMEPCNTYRYPL